MRRKDIDHKRAAKALLAAMDRISGVFVKVDDESEDFDVLYETTIECLTAYRYLCGSKALDRLMAKWDREAEAAFGIAAASVGVISRLR